MFILSCWICGNLTGQVTMIMAGGPDPWTPCPDIPLDAIIIGICIDKSCICQKFGRRPSDANAFSLCSPK